MLQPPIAPPAPPAPPALPAAATTVQGGTPVANAPALPTSTYRDMVPGMPLSARQREQIEDARESLSTQLNSVSGRRDEAAQALRNATGADREGLESRLRQLDARILQIEADFEHTGKLISTPALSMEGGVLVPPPDFSRRDDGPNMTAISVVFTLFVLAPLALAAARNLWRRGTGQRVPAPSLESVQRLERLEQALDSIAVEVERISEGQRFVTRILTEGPAQSILKAGQQGEPVGVPRREAVKVSGQP